MGSVDIKLFRGRSTAVKYDNNINTRGAHLFRLYAQLVTVLELMVLAEINDNLAGIKRGVVYSAGHAMSSFKTKKNKI